MSDHSARHKVQPVLGNRLMAGQRSLDPLIKVRVLVPQPDKNARKGVFCCSRWLQMKGFSVTLWSLLMSLDDDDFRS
jgi:hypothetical protein